MGGFFVDLLTKKPVGLMPTYSLLAGDINQAIFFFLN